MHSGSLVLVSAKPDRWQRVVAPEEELTGGGPLHPETWVYLLEAGGFQDVVAHGSALEHARSSSEAELAQGSTSSFLISAVRPSA
jgi:hypothetical protein